MAHGSIGHIAIGCVATMMLNITSTNLEHARKSKACGRKLPQAPELYLAYLELF